MALGLPVSPQYVCSGVALNRSVWDLLAEYLTDHAQASSYDYRNVKFPNNAVQARWVQLKQYFF